MSKLVAPHLIRNLKGSRNKFGMTMRGDDDVFDGMAGTYPAMTEGQAQRMTIKGSG